jgi:hypothetical protein
MVFREELVQENSHIRNAMIGRFAAIFTEG